MNAKEALEAMKNGDDVKTKELNGVFTLISNGVFFACPGEYPCCHHDMSVAEFLSDYANTEFEKD